MVINEIALLIRLLIGHVTSDFLLQSRGMVDQKGRKVWKSPLLYIHSGIYATVLFMAAARWAQWYWLIPLLLVTHILIDGWKAARGNRTTTFILDQSAHLTVLILCFYMLERGVGQFLGRTFDQAWNSPCLLIIVLGYLIILWPVGRLMNVLTEPFRRQLIEEKSRGLELAGFWIGCLERLFLLSFILFDHLAGVALLLGLKSLFRFGEIKDSTNRKETEYILIGTLLSFGFALAIGLVVRAVLRLLP